MGKSSTSTPPPTSQSNIVIPPPFPAALKKAKLDSQFAKFLKVFKKLNINIPFADALMQMPSYAKFLKEILSNKRKLEEHAMISLTENCSTLVQNKIPPKQKDPGSFSIPYVINDVQFHKALCDLGASIKLMTYSVFRKLSLGEPKSTRMSLQLADRSIKYPRGIIEDVLVKVDKFIFPVNFVVLDMEEDLGMPLILGRHFLETGKTLFDVQKGELHLRVGEEKISFDVFNALKFSQSNEECFQIDDVDSILYDYVQDTFQEPLEAALISPPRDDLINVEIEEMTSYLNDNQSWRKGGKIRLEDLGDRKDLVLQKPSEMETRLLDVLKSHKSVFTWKVADIKSINPSICMPKILMEENINPLVQPQKTLNPKMQEVVKAETIKLLDAGIINPIFDSAWVSPVQCVSKKGGITVIKNEQNDLLPIRTVTVLTSPDWDLPFEVMCDPSDTAVEAALGQRIDKVFRTIYYASKTLNEAQLNYATTEKELLAVVFVLDKFHSYLVLSNIMVYTDHSAIRHLLAKKDAKPRLIRWILLLQEFDLEIKDKKGVENVFADHLSRLECIPDCAQNDTEDIDDWFPDEKLFAIEHSPWYANFENYLVTGTLPHNLCVAEGEMKSILNHCHDREVGGHVEPIKTAAKYLNVGSTGPIFLKMRVLISLSVIDVSGQVVLKFLKKNIFNRFGTPRAIISDGGTHFCNKLFEKLLKKYGEKRLIELNQLEEFRDQAYDMVVSYKERTKRIHDRRIRHKEFKEGEVVLLFNSRLRLFPGKLKSRWSGPYKITKVYPSRAIEIKDARNESFTVNTQRLKHYVGGDVDSTPVNTTLTDQD
ncbi:uncharacterized protein [Henckelia pumila]|uniref:uncharacterized protein n=1 Tax=Henckelia pumila TaxID=405737 RepID=UPI003C6E23C4